MKASMNVEREGAELIYTQYEHSAVLSEQGVLVIWGDSFQDTSRVKGLWMINIAGEDSSINLLVTEEDSICNDCERTITALYTIGESLKHWVSWQLLKYSTVSLLSWLLAQSSSYVVTMVMFMSIVSDFSMKCR